MTPLSNIPGQEIAKKALLSSFNHNRMACTYLFYGPDGVGKWATAVALASLVNCEQPVKDNNKVIDACGECRNCRQIMNLNFPELHLALPLPPHKNASEAIELNLDYMEKKREEPFRIISSARQLTIPINTARSIKRKTAVKSPVGIKRIILFYQMERMRESSADSLLKLIEEPPPETTIILTAGSKDNLLPTIQSRSQKIPFRPITVEAVEQFLVEKKEVSTDKAKFISPLSEGSIGRALSLMADDSEISLRQESYLMFKALFQKDTPSALATLNEFINPFNKGEMEQKIAYWQSFLSDIILLKCAENPSEIVNADLSVELESLSVHIIDLNNFSLILDNIKKTLFSFKRNVHIRPALIALGLGLRKYIS